MAPLLHIQHVQLDIELSAVAALIYSQYYCTLAVSPTAVGVVLIWDYREKREILFV